VSDHDGWLLVTSKCASLSQTLSLYSVAALDLQASSSINMMGVRTCRRHYTFILLVAVCLLSASTTTAAKEQPPKKRSASEISVSPEFYTMCVGVSPLAQKGGVKKRLQWLIEASGKNTILMQTSPQHLAACWILHRDHKRSSNKSVMLQRYALATLHFATTHSNTTVWDWNKVDLYDPRAPPPVAAATRPTKAGTRRRRRLPNPRNMCRTTG
jgi:hypothetical protein